MHLIKPSFLIEDYFPKDNLWLKKIGKTCYQSDETKGVSDKFVARLIDKGHLSVIEHSTMTVRFICDRGVSHELVRHRLASFSQESTRYCNYSDHLTFIIPPWFPEIEVGHYCVEKNYGLVEPAFWWFYSMLNAEETYKTLIGLGQSPQQARAILPNSLKTELVMTANFREWRHIFKLRCSPAAHPQMRELMIPLRDKCREFNPIVFGELE